MTSRDWDAVLRRLAETPDAALHAHGQMTDDVLRRIANVPGVTTLHLGGCRMLTDEGISHLAAMPGLRHLDLSGTAITDRGLDVLRHLPHLEYLSLGGPRVTDAGARMLAHCPALEEVTLAGTRTGDGALRALAGMTALRQLRTGHAVTDAGLALLREIPVYRTWLGGAVVMGLTSYDAAPNQIMLRGTFTDRGMEHLRGLDGLFGLQLDDAALAITARAMEPLTTLPHLGWLAVELPVSCLNVDDQGIAALPAFPALRELMPMDIPDAGYAHVGRCAALESLVLMYCREATDAATERITALSALRSYFNSYTTITGRTPALLSTMDSLDRITFDTCHGLTDAGLATLSRLPRLRILGASGKQLTAAVAQAFRPASRCAWAAEAHRFVISARLDPRCSTANPRASSRAIIASRSGFVIGVLPGAR